jgi:hypothetical protein
MKGESDPQGEPEPPPLADGASWYTEHTALLISTSKWALLGAAAGACVGEATRAFHVVGHRRVDAIQKLGFSKSAGLEVPLGVPIGEALRDGVRIPKGSLTDLVHRRVRGRTKAPRKP